MFEIESDIDGKRGAVGPAIGPWVGSAAGCGVWAGAEAPPTANESETADNEPQNVRREIISALRMVGLAHDPEKVQTFPDKIMREIKEYHERCRFNLI
jgi:hypothetical protein